MDNRITEEQLNQKYDPQSENFDKEAYRAYLLDQHEKIIGQQTEKTWRIEPEELDISSEKFDVDQYIVDRIRTSERAPELYKLMQDIALQTMEQIYDVKPLPLKDMEKAEGVVTTLNERITVPSVLSMEDAFSPQRVKILPLNSTVTQESGAVSVPDDSEIEAAWKVNTAKMATLLRMRELTSVGNGFNVVVYLPKICREISIDPRKYSSLRKTDNRSVQQQRFDTFTRWIAPLETYMSEICGVYYRVVTVVKYDEMSETVTLDMPYFFRLYEEIQEFQTSQVTNTFFHSDVANEENEVAIDVAFYLGNSVLRRGLKTCDKPDEEKYTYRTSYATLISNVPRLHKTLDEILSRPKPIAGQDTRTADFNITLKRIMETAFRILLEKSEFPKVYVGFSINGVTQWEDTASQKKRKNDPKSGNRRTASKRFNIPTKSYLTNTLKITHNGKNPNYQPQ